MFSKKMELYNQNLIKQFIEKQKYRELAELLSFKVSLNQLKYDLFVNNNKLKFSLSTIYWHKDNTKIYNRISVTKEINTNDFNAKNKQIIRKDLIKQIYYQLIKKEIMMI